MNSVIEFMKECFLLVKVFFKKPQVHKEHVLGLSKPMKKLYFRLGTFKLLSTGIVLFFSFMLKLCNLAIEHRFIITGIILFMLYYAVNVLNNAFKLYEDSITNEIEQNLDSELIYRGGKILSIVSNKVLKKDEKNNLYVNLSHEEIINCVKNYLRSSWKLNLRYYFNIIEAVNIMGMLIAAIVVNTTINKYLFIAIIIVFVIASIIVSVYACKANTDFVTNRKKITNIQSQLANDMIRVNPIVKKDLSMRINKFKDSIEHGIENTKSFQSKKRVSDLIISSMQLMIKYGFILLYFFNIDFNSITVATIAEIIANVAIIETAIKYIQILIIKVNDVNNETINLKNESKDLNLIMSVYNKELEKQQESNTKEVSEIVLDPFEIKYKELSNNDVGFSLKLENSLTLKKGDVAILYGSSGSGKSTFMKLLTQKLVLNKQDVPSTNRFLMYDETLSFGCLSIYDELFCLEKPDLDKMKFILMSFNLWQEISSNCLDVWQWMKEKKFNAALSNGQKQRLILTKILYWLDDSIDMIVLDEATSGLDEKGGKDAQEVLEFITKYANKDKERIIIIATHQNLDLYKSRIKNPIKSIYFTKDETKGVGYINF